MTGKIDAADREALDDGSHDFDELPERRKAAGVDEVVQAIRERVSRHRDGNKRDDEPRRRKTTAAGASLTALLIRCRARRRWFARGWRPNATGRQLLKRATAPTGLACHHRATPGLA